jgi:hypothetical protein
MLEDLDLEERTRPEWVDQLQQEAGKHEPGTNL